MNKTLRQIDSSWEIRYSEYVGTLTMFDPEAGLLNSDEIRKDYINENLVLISLKKTGKLMIVEVYDADRIVKDIDQLDKNEVIKIIKEYINANYKTAQHCRATTSCY